jgi:hypothetical protein
MVTRSNFAAFVSLIAKLLFYRTSGWRWLYNERLYTACKRSPSLITTVTTSQNAIGYIRYYFMGLSNSVFYLTITVTLPWLKFLECLPVPSSEPEDSRTYLKICHNRPIPYLPSLSSKIIFPSSYVDSEVEATNLNKFRVFWDLNNEILNGFEH